MRIAHPPVPKSPTGKEQIGTDLIVAMDSVLHAVGYFVHDGRPREIWDLP